MDVPAHVAPPSPILWPASSRTRNLLHAFLVMLCIAYGGVIVAALWTLHATLFVDFFGFWSATRFVATHADVAAVYNAHAFDIFQQQLYPEIARTYRFLYPPSIWLLIYPLALLPYGIAFAIWTVATVAAYLASVCVGEWRRDEVIALVIAPTTTIAIFYGQTGLLAAALLIGGLRLLRTRPWLAGILFGLLTMKPQFGVLLPVALLAGGYWRSIAAAVVTFLTCVAASTLAFGDSIWLVWARSLPVNAPFPESRRLALDALMPTIAANLDMIGTAPTVARLAQALLVLACAAVIWRVWRRGATPLAIAALAAAALLATPYAFVYDMPLVTAAVLLVFRDAAATGQPLGRWELLVLAFAVLVPAEIFTPLGPPLPVGPVALAALVAVILRRIRLADA
jgi:hypothetical protein